MRDIKTITPVALYARRMRRKSATGIITAI
jgi:hypothetical protein